MKVTSKLMFHKLIVFIIILFAIICRPFSIALALLIIGISYIYDFHFRKCPICGNHININESIKHGDHCKKCGELFDKETNKND